MNEASSAPMVRLRDMGVPVMSADHAEPSASFTITWPAAVSSYEPPSTLVAGIFPRTGIAVVRGASNTGKTALVLDVAAAVARGIPWRSRRTIQGIVLYVAAENPGSVKTRLKGYVMRWPDSVGMLMGIVNQSVNLMDRAEVGSFVTFAKSIKDSHIMPIGMVVIDTLAASMAGGDENSARDMGLAIAGMATIRDELQTLVVAVHHTGKDETKGARGSSALRAAVDTELAVAGQTGIRTAMVEKQRDLPTGETFGFTLEPVVVGRDDSGDITTVVVAEADAKSVRRPAGKAQAAILNAMEAGDKERIWSRDDLKVAANAAGILHRNSIRDAVDKLQADGYVTPCVGGYRLA